MEKIKKINVPVEQYYQLIVTQDELQFLYDILIRVGGMPENSRRKHADNLVKTFVQHVKPYGSLSSVTNDLKGSIECKDIED